MADSDRSAPVAQVLSKRPLQVLSEITPDDAEISEQSDKSVKTEVLTYTNPHLQELIR